MIVGRSGTLCMGNGDFVIERPNRTRTQVRLRTGWPLYPLTSPQGRGPTDYLIRICERGSMVSGTQIYSHLRRFALWLVKNGRETFIWDDLDEPLWMCYFDHLRANKQAFRTLKAMYCWAAGHGYDGFHKDRARALVQLKTPGSRKGEAVRNPERYPTQASLSEVDFQTVRRCLSLDSSPLLSRVCAHLSLELGANVAQYCQLLLHDFHDFSGMLIDGADGEAQYQIDMPRSKKRDGYTTRKRRPLSPDLGRMLAEYIGSTSTARDALGLEDPPLLIGNGGEPFNVSAFTHALNRFIKRADVAITGSLTARRLRRTFLSRIVDEGASKEVVVELADHSDDQTILVYFEARGATTLARIDAAVDPALTPLVRRFQGVIVASEAKAELGDYSEQRMMASVETGDIGVGTCGRDIATHGLCPLTPPFACYICPRFQAWRTADHRSFAQSIQATRNNLAALHPAQAGGRVVKQLDVVIQAFHEVADACEAGDVGRRRTVEKTARIAAEEEEKA